MSLADNFRSATPARQALVVLGAAALFAVLAYGLWAAVLRTSYAPVFTNLKPDDAATIIEELERRKTPYKIGDGGAAVLVPQADVDATRISILGSELPLKGAVGFELFNKTDMGLTEFAQKINYQRALQGELARTLMALDTIDTARVHLSLPEAAIFERDKRPAKASVTIATRTGARIDAGAVRGIQKLIASAVPQLDPTYVTILDSHGELLSADVPVITASSPAMDQKRAVEQYYSGRIRAALTPIINDPAMRVLVDAGVDSFAEPGAIDGGVTQSAFSVEQRDFPIRISVELSGEPDPALRGKVLDALKSAAGFDQSRGDSLSMAIGATAPTQPSAPQAVGAYRPPAPVLAPASQYAVPAWWPFVALAGLAALIVLVAMRWRHPGAAMATDQRDAFAQRLKALLDE